MTNPYPKFIQTLMDNKTTAKVIPADGKVYKMTRSSNHWCEFSIDGKITGRGYSNNMMRLLRKWNAAF